MILATLLSVVPFFQPIQEDPKPVERTECSSRVSLPMLPGHRSAPLIELSIGGKPYHFLLDTGAQGGRISPAIVESLGIQPIGEITAGDPSGKGERQVKIYSIPEIDAGSAKFYGVSMFADAGPQGGPAGLADGVISAGMFQDLLLTLDYPGKQVVFEPGSLPSSAISYSLMHGLPALPIQIGNVKLMGHVDSGSDGGLMVPLKYKSQLPLDGGAKVIGKARTLFNEITIYGAKVKGPITIGGMAINVPMIEMHDMFPVGNIGGKVLSQYKVTLDQKHKRIQFEKPAI